METKPAETPGERSVQELSVQLNLINYSPVLPDAPDTGLVNFYDQVIHGDCEQVLAQLPDNCIDLIVTSPPYADQRKSTYGGIPPDRYVEWWMPKAAQFLRVLKPTGSFILNIKERVVNGERHTYVMELVIEMRRSGWLWTEEYMWHKKTRTLANGRTGFATTGSTCFISQNQNTSRCTRIM